MFPLFHIECTGSLLTFIECIWVPKDAFIWFLDGPPNKAVNPSTAAPMASALSIPTRRVPDTQHVLQHDCLDEETYWDRICRIKTKSHALEKDLFPDRFIYL